MSYEVCKECGEKNPIYANYCQECGKSLNNNSKYNNDVDNIISIINLDVHKAENQTKGKVKYLFENEELFVEELSIKYYENMGYNASWTENYYW
jgi:predicted amidophosphoribosyltransferase